MIAFTQNNQPGADDVDSPANTDGHTEPGTSHNGHNTGTSSPELCSAPDADLSALEKHIQHADAFIIMYSVTDQCSFDDCNRLRFLINYNSKQRRRSLTRDKDALDIPVMLVGNKKDQRDDRMVDVAQGRRMYQQIACAGFHEISVRESADEVWNVFRDLCRCWRIFQHYPKLRRSTSDAQTISYMLLSPEVGMGGGGGPGASGGSAGTSGGYFDGWWSRSTEKRPSFFAFRSNGSTSAIAAPPVAAAGGSSSSSSQQSPTAEDGDTAATSATTVTSKKLSIRIPTNYQQQQQLQNHQLQPQQQPFRERAATDGKILSRPRRWQYMTAGSATAAAAAISVPVAPAMRVERRMSISQRGSNGN